MIRAIELRLLRQLPREHSTRQRYPRQNSHLFLLRLFEENIRRTLPETVEDDLHGFDVRIFNGLQRLLHSLHAHAVVADLARVHHAIQRVENFRTIVDGGWWAMKLQKIE